MKTIRFIVMTNPKNFDVVYKINPWMTPEKKVKKEKAVENWERLKKTYEDLGLKVFVIDQAEALPDGVFAANGAFVYGDTAIIANFKYPQRKPEAKYYQKFFQEKGFKTIQPDFFYEGQGDSLLLDNYLLQGYGIRSDKKIIKLMQEYFEFEVIPLKLINPKYYHLDTAILPLSKKRLFYVPEAFEEKTIKLLEKYFEAYQLTKEEAESFAANSILIKDTVVTNKPIPQSFVEKIKEMGYKHIAIDYYEFFKAGGSVKCTTLEVF